MSESVVPAAPSPRWVAFLTVLVFLLCFRGRTLLLWALGTDADALPRVSAQVLMWTLWVVPSAALVAALFGPRQVLRVTGLDRQVLRALGMAALCTLPMLAGFALHYPPRESIGLLDFTLASPAPAFTEEFLFRGFAFGLLFRHARWGFLPAVLLTAVAFGTGHLYQGHDVGSAVQVLLVTLAGGAWLAWLAAEWNTLWVPIFLHALMNALWFVYQVDTSALGSGYANAFRGATIALSVVITVRRCRRRGHFQVRRQSLLVNPDPPGGRGV